MKRVIAVFMMVFLLSGAAFAASSVTYEGGAEKFVFLPGSEYSETDLFENFKNVLPGDVLEQKITVKNDTDGIVRIFMRADPVSEKDRDFLSQMTMTVESANKELFDAQASETAQLTKNTLIGAFKSKGSTELTVKLYVPVTLGSEYMGRQGTIPWTFLVEEIEVDDTPDTGDWFEMGAWLGAAVVLAAAALVLIVVQKKRSAQEN